MRFKSRPSSACRLTQCVPYVLSILYKINKTFELIRREKISDPPRSSWCSSCHLLTVPSWHKKMNSAHVSSWPVPSIRIDDRQKIRGLLESYRRFESTRPKDIKATCTAQLLCIVATAGYCRQPVWRTWLLQSCGVHGLRFSVDGLACVFQKKSAQMKPIGVIPVRLAIRAFLLDRSSQPGRLIKAWSWDIQQTAVERLASFLAYFHTLLCVCLYVCVYVCVYGRGSVEMTRQRKSARTRSLFGTRCIRCRLAQSTLSLFITICRLPIPTVDPRLSSRISSCSATSGANKFASFIKPWDGRDLCEIPLKLPLRASL